MRVRFPVDEDPSSTRDPPDVAPSSSNTNLLRTAFLVALGTAVVAYAVSRALSSRDEDVDASLEAIRERTTDAVPTAVGERVPDAVPSAVGERVPDAVPTDAQAIPISGVGRDADDPDSGADTDASSETDASSDAAVSGGPIDDSETNVDLADERSSTEIDERTTDEIAEEPAEPGEMAVDDSVEDLIDEENDSEPAAEEGAESDADEE